MFLRVGRSSLHREWIGDPATRSYDVWLDYWADGENPWGGEPARVTVGRGTFKYLRAHALLDELLAYDAVWMPDPDIGVSAAGVEAMFEVFHATGALLAQPALEDGSYFSHEVTLRNRGFAARYTNFVEAMAPVFSREALRACGPSFDEIPSSYGLDLVWSRILGDPRDRLAILDATPVRHTQPVGAGDWYRRCGFDHDEDKRRVCAAHGVPLPFAVRQYGGLVAPSGGPVLPAGARFLARLVGGAPRSQRFRRRYHSRMLKSVLAGRRA